MKMRLFVGIALSPAVTEELKRLTAKLRRADDKLRWSSPDSWHITLQFLGSTERDRYECLLARLHEIHRPPLSIRLDAPGIFERAGIIQIGIHPSENLTALERHVVAASALCGVEPEKRPYHPHITLARSKDREGSDSLASLNRRLHSRKTLPHFTAEEFLLYESIPTPSGSRYEVRERFFLRV
jgi:2'-5' RNA ligase